MKNVLNKLTEFRKNHPKYAPRKIQFTSTISNKLDFSNFQNDISSDEEEPKKLNFDFLGTTIKDKKKPVKSVN